MNTNLQSFLNFAKAILVFCIAFNAAKAQNFSITRLPDLAICSSTYPSNYFPAGNFTFTELNVTRNKALTRNQVSKTLVLNFSTANFEFKLNSGSVTASGTEVTINSLVIAATSITVTMSTAATNVEKNVLTFSGFEIRAMTGPGTATLRRSGGTFKINNKTTVPGTGASWKTITASTAYSFASAAASQPSTATVFSNSSDNQILGVQVAITGTCNPLSATSFSFSTAGSTNASTDISNAKLYYTGITNSFSTATLFGSTANPNGNFIISGSQSLSLGGGTYYFWLVYDIRPTATNANVIDAQASSVTLGGTPNSFTGNPTGTRAISNNIFHSIAAGNWSTTTNWSLTSGGASCGCAPTAGSGQVFVNHAIVVDNNYTVNDLVVQTGGNLTNAVSRALTVSGTLSTSGTGLFTISQPWTLKDISLVGSGISGSGLHNL